MTRTEWMAKVNENAEALRYLLGNWHPASRGPRQKEMERVLVCGEYVEIEKAYPITAQGAEQACQAIRRDIVTNYEGDPVERFNRAIAQQDVGTINKLLNEAWFGVPESTSCWSIRGFSEAVDLIEDPCDEEEEQAHQG